MNMIRHTIGLSALCLVLAGCAGPTLKDEAPMAEFLMASATL